MTLRLFSMRDMAMTESRLQEKLFELTERLAAIQRDRRAGLDPDSQERAAQLENYDVLDRLADEAHEEVEKVRAAVRRLHTGSYGLCIACGDAIDESRLAAYPQASHCMVCAAPAAPAPPRRTAV